MRHNRVSKMFKVKTNPKLTLFQYYVGITRLIKNKIDRWNMNLEHKLNFKILENPRRYYIKDEEFEKKRQEIDKTWEKYRQKKSVKIDVRNSIKNLIKDLNDIHVDLKTPIIKELYELKLDGQIKDYHMVREYNETLTQKSYAIVLDFNNGKQVKFDPISMNVDGIPHTFNAIYENGNGSAEALLRAKYNKNGDIDLIKIVD